MTVVPGEGVEVALEGDRTFVGFGFGAIQAGLFLYEAFKSNGFRRLVVAHRNPDVVRSVREAGGLFPVNIARSDGIEHTVVGPIEIENPAVVRDRERLIEAVSQAEEVATALPGIHSYYSDAPGSVHRILAEGLRLKYLRGGPRALVYTAENHNHAAGILEGHVLALIPDTEREGVKSRVQFLNTVIGKMSGIITDPDEAQKWGLKTVAREDRRVFLVEAFNRILISRINPAPATPSRRGLKVFEEKDDLLPFEEAKLYGHNATHALAAYLGAFHGVRLIADLKELPGVIEFLRSAFIGESGEALIRRHSGVDRLFTREGYLEYAEDLLARMTNPWLRDTVRRVGRDAMRKLAWDDRLIGTMRVVLSQGLEPRRYGLGAAAALNAVDPGFIEGNEAASGIADRLWDSAGPEEREKRAIIALIEEGRNILRIWRESGFRNLEETFLRGRAC